jgi:hypothetical protein
MHHVLQAVNVERSNIALPESLVWFRSIEVPYVAYKFLLLKVLLQ